MGEDISEKPLEAFGEVVVYGSTAPEELHARIADAEVIVLNKGSVAADGTPREVFSESEKLIAVGLDVPQVTELMYDLELSGTPLDHTELDEKKCAEAIIKLYKNKKQ